MPEAVQCRNAFALIQLLERMRQTYGPRKQITVCAAGWCDVVGLNTPRNVWAKAREYLSDALVADRAVRSDSA